MTRVDSSRASAWERHGQSVIAALMLGILLWVGKSTAEQTTNDAVIFAKIETLESKIESMEIQLIARMDDRYRGSDARRDFEERDRRISANETKIDAFGAEQARRGPRISELERQIRGLIADHKNDSK